MSQLNDLEALTLVACAGGFREAARRAKLSASGLSEAVTRLEASLGVRLLARTTRSVRLTDAGQELVARIAPALSEIDAALDVVNSFRDSPMGTLRLNVPVVATRLILPALLPAFLAAHPGIKVEVIADDSFVDLVASGCDAGIRYDERLEQDMIAVPIGPRRQRYACAAAPRYLARRTAPAHPRDLLDHDCITGQFASGAMARWEFERGGQTIELEPQGPLIVRIGGGAELIVDMAIAGVGIILLFEDWLRPHFESGALTPLMEDWWCEFSGPFLYYPGRRLVPAPLRAFIDFLAARRG